MGIIYPRLKKMRTLGAMPAQVPESDFMQRLPQNPLVLGVICAIVFAALAIGVNGLLLWFFGICNLAFVPWTVYKIVYATVLSVKIVEFCIFRYVQPDWTTTGLCANTETRKEFQGKPVRNPLPKIGVFKEMFGSIAGNIAMNIIIGSVLGSVTVGADGSVVILPTTVEGISITGLVFGLITGIIVTNGVIKAMKATIMSYPGLIEGAVMDKRLAWMPRGGVSLACLMSICLMVFSAMALRAVMILFGISFLNFYQFVVFITVYATLISKPLIFVLTRRCMQPDYIHYTLEKTRVIE